MIYYNRSLIRKKTTTADPDEVISDEQSDLGSQCLLKTVDPDETASVLFNFVCHLEF